MSDLATAPVTTAPAVETAAAPEVAEQAKPTNAREAAQNARARAQDVISGNVAAEINSARKPHHSETQPRENGKFASESPPAAEVAGAETPVAEAPAAATPEAAPEQPKFVRIELPADHPLRLQGRTHVTVDANDDQAVRALLNNPVRRQEVEAERRARQAAEAEAAGWKGVIQGLVQNNPEVIQNYLVLKEQAPEVAESYLRGEMSKLESSVTEQRTAAEQEFEAQQLEQQGRQFMDSAWQAATSRYPAWFINTPEYQQAFQRTMFAYGAELERGLSQSAEVAEVLRRLDFHYMNHPHTQQYLSAQIQQRNTATAEQIRQQAAREAEEKQRQQLAELANRARTNPQGRIPSAANTGQQAMPVSVGPRNAREAQELARARASGRVA